MLVELFDTFSRGVAEVALQVRHMFVKARKAEVAFDRDTECISP